MSISNNTLRITPKTSKDITCTVEYERVRTLQEIAKEIKDKSKGSLSSDNFKAGCPTSGNTECSGVYKMADYSNSTSLNPDNPGGTSYYFRGEAKDNYVKFGRGTTSDNNSSHDLTWRIVRINGDGSIRLVLDNDIGTSAFNDYSTYEKKYAGYTYDNDSPCTNTSPCTSKEIATNVEDQMGTTDHGGKNSTIKTKLEQWYYDNLISYDQYIAYGIYCNDTSYESGSETGALYYGANVRLYENTSPQLTCPDPKAGSNPSLSDTSNGYHTYGGVYKLKIGLLSADEIILAGFKPSSDGVTYYSNYLYYTPRLSDYFWSSSPLDFISGNAYGFNGHLYNRYLNDANGARPVINLKTEGLKATGEGTKDDPFVIK